MNRNLFLNLLLLLIFSSCYEKNNSNINNVLVDKIWISSLNKRQYYLSSKDGRKYLWMTFERRDGGSYAPFSEAKGTPESHPLKLTYHKYKEGWAALNYFK